MGIVIEAAYSKKLGLPNFSSHSFVVSIRAELPNIEDVDGECARLYKLLQRGVDREIKRVGYMPDALKYGMKRKPAVKPATKPDNGEWSCTIAQKTMIMNLVEEHNLPKRQVDDFAKQLHGVGVRGLNRKQASGFIEELMKRHAAVTEVQVAP